MFLPPVVLSSATLLLLLAVTTTAFQLTPTASTLCRCRPTTPLRRGDSSLNENSDSDTTASSDDDDDDDKAIGTVQRLLSDKFPSFYALLAKNDDVWKTLLQADEDASSDSNKGFTIFAPNEAAFDKLGEKKRAQLQDPRNLETVQKMGLYHVVPAQAVTAQQLRTEDWRGPKPADGGPRPLTVGGLVTLGGEVPVGRSKSGGLFGLGAKEDRDAVIGPDARIVQSFTFRNADCIVHEVDALISPTILWRYCDQLRIPGF